MQYYYKDQKQQFGDVVEQYIRDVNFFRFNWHSEIEFLILLQGHINFCTDGRIHTLHEDDVFLVNSNRGHALIAEEKNSIALVLHFSPEFFSELSPVFKNLQIHCYSTEKTRYEPRFQRLRQYAAQMMLAAISDKISAQFTLRGAFSMLLGTLLSEFPADQNNSLKFRHDRKNQKNINIIIDYLERNFDKKITLDMVSRIARYNRTYFSTYFKKNVGISFYDYLTRIRFRHALYQLNYTDHSITNIAIDCGFPDLKTFSAYYKKNFHEPPSAQLRVQRTNPFPPAKEEERTYLEVGTPYIDRKLHSYAQLAIGPQTPDVPVSPPQTQEADFARIATLCAEIMGIASQKSRTILEH